jgi:hypothetical protein
MFVGGYIIEVSSLGVMEFADGLANYSLPGF